AYLGSSTPSAQLRGTAPAPGGRYFSGGADSGRGTLVAPDTRRAVDFASRRRMLDELGDEVAATHDRVALARDLVKRTDDGRVKLFVTREALVFRRARAALFRDGAYHGLEIAGSHAEHLCAFARTAPGLP